MNVANLFGVLALLTLLTSITAHVFLVRALAPRLTRGRMVLGACLPPLAVLDGLGGAARREAITAVSAFVLHAVVVVLARVVAS